MKLETLKLENSWASGYWYTDPETNTKTFVKAQDYDTQEDALKFIQSQEQEDKLLNETTQH
ncbi:hypothetical protein KR611_14120 [Acinetobacter baumannii]|nr:hypothetical protein [Acinetobacter baumannii]MCE6089499.1 hypothetical protein [Acinetobacter baumannii]MCE6126043.1 hypothetical protein [Acinetobacter baumannii]MCE6129725.1 hypothetical protein [Acinetobacter baumannii]MCE6139552.1 hypothetical protein [Acinetobacter baumannii]